MKRHIVIGVDFDHTLVNNPDIELGERYAKPFPGAKEAMLELHNNKGYFMLIHSCNRKAWVEEWLDHYNIPYDAVWDGQGKPVCDAYIDDRGVGFRGDWTVTLKETLELVEPNVKE